MACDQAVKSCSSALGSCNELAEAQKKALAEQAVEIDRLQRSTSGILNSPVFWLVAGIAVGSITTAIVSK